MSHLFKHWVQVTYSGDVEWRSPGGTLVQFGDSGNMSVAGTTVTVSPLIPGTRYHFKVSAITPTGRGAEKSVFNSTRNYSGKVHQVQIQGEGFLGC